MQKISLVWLKRDLRLADHSPLKEAIESGHPILLCYIFEPSLKNAPQSDLRHFRFIWQSLLDMDIALIKWDYSVQVLNGEIADIFPHLQNSFDIQAVYSHQETGIDLTFKRDLWVKKFLKNKNIPWFEYSQQGVLRGRKDRKQWREHWFTYSKGELAQPGYSKAKWIELDSATKKRFDVSFLSEEFSLSSSNMQKGGESLGRKYLKSFLEDRVKNYNRHISKPELSRRGCSRLSPYLAWGCLSIRQVYQCADHKKSEKKQVGNLTNFMSRLRWHCHFIQKFEMESRMEFESINRGFHQFHIEENSRWVERWESGTTGYPLVDACMRCLKETGYLNFRMRAMLVSFLTHHLGQHWKSGADHLARLFLDFEPGIHYPQLQMQAGVTGINTVRIYNPVKQSYEQDPEGIFIKKWISELRNIPSGLVHEPWKLSMMEQQLYGLEIGKDYPKPIVDLEESGRNAREFIWRIQKDKEVQKEARRILAKHTLANRWA